MQSGKRSAFDISVGASTDKELAFSMKLGEQMMQV
jgi:hypothetical protein